jgi:predicted acyltransferase (DUF342 family)
MKKFFRYFCLLIVTLSFTSVYSQNTTNTSRENWLPVRGNVGIGTRTPAYDLDVIGNIRATNSIFSQSLETTLLKTGTFNLSGNAFINGSLGLGVATPSERLDVLGNIKLSGILTGQGLNVQTLNSNTGVFNSLTVNQNSLFNGNVGIGITPAEKLHVNGNARIENDLYSNKFTTTFITTNQLNAGLSTFSENVTFSKNALVTGKIGIGISSPSEALDVSGNIKSNAGLFSSTLNTGMAQFNSLNVLQNSTFNGLVGIGVTSPAEKLHIGGNLKVDNSIFSTSLTTSNFQTAQFNATGLSAFGDKATFSKDLITNGKIGIGVASPSESLDINGNAKLTGSVTSASVTSSQGNFSQGLTAGNTNITGTLSVAGQLNAANISLSDISVSNNASIGKDLTVTGASTLNGGATIGGTTKTNNLQVDGTLNGGLANFSQGITAGNSTVNGNLNVTGHLTAQSISLSDINATNNVSVGKDLSVVGESTLTGGATIGGTSTANNLEVTGTFKAGTIAITDLSTTGNATVGQNLIVTGQITAPTITSTNLNNSNNISVGQNLTVNGGSNLKGDVSIGGSSTITGNLTVSGIISGSNLSLNDVNTNGSATIAQNLTVNGLSQLGGDLQVGGAIKAGVIEATEFRTTGGASPFNFDNAVISQTLAISTANNTVPGNYKLAVGGNIIATGIDVKIPQKWPDYVFTEQHQRMTLVELQQYIDKYGHLPGIASEEEMKEKQNYSVSEMDAKLLEKVEELTLYILELKKEIEQLKKK